MNAQSSPITVLDDTRSWELLRSQRIGRLVTTVGNVVDIAPINYAVDAQSIVFRTAAGTKLAGLTIHPEVVFEADEIGTETGWSVVVHGIARVLEDDAEIAAADTLGLHPMVATLKPHYVRIEATAVSGRGFEFGGDPGREGEDIGGPDSGSDAD